MSKVIFHNAKSLAVAALGGALAAACSKPPAQKNPPVPVELSPVATIAAPTVLNSNGTVEPMQTVAVEAQVGGTLEEVDFAEGQDVQAGQVLFRIDPRPFEAALRQAQATLARDQAQAATAQREAERYKALVEKDYVTKSQADQAQSSAEALQATVQADKAAVDNAQLNLNYTTIRAPITGRTGRLLVRQGNLVKPGGDPLVVINTLHPILVRFPVLQHDFPALQRRAAQGPVPVRVVTADSGKVGDVGTLSFLDNAVDSLTGTVTVKARFENQTNALWPGEYVTVNVELSVQNDALAVQTRALQAGQDGNFVFVVGKDKKAVVRPVKVGRVVGDMTTIDTGLVAGEEVVVDGQSRLIPNAIVDTKAKPAAVQAGTASGQGGGVSK